MNKNEELQKWLNDDRYVQAKELEIMWNVGRGGVGDFLRSRKIKNVKKIGTRQGVYVFYDKQQCVNARAIYNAKIQELQNWLNDTKFIQKQELALKWGVTVSAVASFLYNRNINSIKKIHNGGASSYAFYDRAECERARPFINQPKKEVEKVENIGELATATKHQILSETGADNFVWDKVTMKHKIMPVKNYCDERGNFVSLFNKDESVSAILEYKSEQKQLLEKCLADKNLVTTTDLAKIWNTNKKSIYNKIYRLKIKPYAKVKLENGNIWHFYKKSDCIESQDVEKVEQNELPKMKQETAETMPDIIPADTIDLFTMSELESELKQRGVELTDEVKAKISASDTPEMQEIATMIRGNAKSIAIRLSVLNEIAKQLKNTDESLKAETEIDSKDISQFYMPLFDVAESANMSKDKARYWLKLADCSPVVKDRVDLWPIEAVNILKKMQTRVENDMTPNAAAAILKIESHDNEATNDANRPDSEFTSIRIGKAERQKLRIMAVENRSGITEQLHLIINSLFGLTYRK